jgi:hypothetical protein
MGWATFSAIFFTHSSGHSACSMNQSHWPHANICRKMFVQKKREMSDFFRTIALDTRAEAILVSINLSLLSPFLSPQGEKNCKVFVDQSAIVCCAVAAAAAM